MVKFCIVLIDCALESRKRNVNLQLPISFPEISDTCPKGDQISVICDSPTQDSDKIFMPF